MTRWFRVAAVPTDGGQAAEELSPAVTPRLTLALQGVVLYRTPADLALHQHQSVEPRLSVWCLLSCSSAVALLGSVMNTASHSSLPTQHLCSGRDLAAAVGGW